MDAFDNSANLTHSIALAAILSPAFAALFVGLRFYTARVILRGIHRDDWLILAALACSIGYTVAEFYQLKYGLGKHISEVHNKKYTFYMYMLISAFPIAILNNFVTLFTKASILAFYLRFSVSRKLNIAIYTVLSVVIGYTLAGAFSFLYACKPMARFWDFSVPGTCIDANPWYGTLVSLNVLTDATLLLLPIWLLRPLRAGFTQKLAIGAILGTGGFVLAVSIYRLYITVFFFTDNDFLYRYGVNYMWLTIEINVAIICACMPCLRALAGRVLPSLMTINPVRDPMRLNTISVAENDMEGFVEADKRGKPLGMWQDGREGSVFFGSERASSRGGGDEEAGRRS